MFMPDTVPGFEITERNAGKILALPMSLLGEG